MRTDLLILSTLTCIVGGAADVTAQSPAESSRAMRKILAGFADAEDRISIASPLTATIRKRATATLDFTLLFNEQKEQRLIVPRRKGRPLGYVHARSEGGEWGLVEIVWSFDLDLRVRAFELQRCRSRARKDIESPGFRERLAGKSFVELKELLTKDYLSLESRDLGLSKKAESLAVTVIRSAVKAIKATELCWGHPGEIRAALLHVHRTLPDARSLERFEDLYDRKTKLAIRRQLRAYGGTGLDPSTARLFVGRDASGRRVGALIRGDWKNGAKRLTTWWHLDPRPVVRGVEFVGWSSASAKRGFADVVGMTLGDVATASTEARFVAAEVLLVAKALLGRKQLKEKR